MVPSLPTPPPPRPVPVITSAQNIADANAELDRVLKTPSAIRRLRAAAAGTTRKIQDSDARVSDLLREAEERAALRREAEGKT